MNICLLNDSFPPVIDGVVNVMMNYARYLQSDFQAGVIVGTPGYPGADYSQYPYPVVPYPSFDTAAVTNGYRTGNPFESQSVSRLARFAPDLIHSHCPASATVIARILREETGAPIVFTYHTKYDIDIRRAVKIKPIADEGIRAMVSNIEACDEIWTVSRGAGESLKALGYQGDYLVMNNGVDFEKGRADQEKVSQAVSGWDLPENVPVFLYVGRLMNYKGLPLLLDALKLLKDGGQDFRMVFVGKGPDGDFLKEKAEELGLSEKGEGPGKCFFTGPVYDREVLRAWNTRADLFLFPSPFDPNGLVVREAAACGLASVLIRDSCAAEGITDGRNGFLVEENAESLAAFLREACQDLSRLHEAGQHAMEEIYLSWQSCVAAAYDRYGYVLEEKKRGAYEGKRKQATDLLVSATAHGMEQQEKLRQLTEERKAKLRQFGVEQSEKLSRIGKEFFQDWKETATGMMENIQEAEESAEEFWNSLFPDLRGKDNPGKKEDHE